MQLEERKRKRRCEYDCKDHIFNFQTLKASCSKYDIRIQFCPKFQRDPLPPDHTFPQYNDDGKYFTSAFILGVDRRILVKNEQQELMDHQKQIRDSLEKHNQLVFPRPNSKHSLCSVCKEHYRNYYYHVSSEEHRQRISLSSYNNHINDLCNIYRSLWDGCEEKADEEAERMASEEEDRRQRMAEAEPEEQYTNSLLDCQRGEEPERYDENGDPISRPRHIGRRPSSRSFANNDDTVTIGRSHKRGNPDARSAYEPALRKHYYNGQFNPAHAARERKQRNYERERMKLMKGTQFQKYKKDFVALPNTEDDIFTVLLPAQGAPSGTVEAPPKRVVLQRVEKLKKVHEEIPKKIVIENFPEEQLENQEDSSSSQSSSSSASSSSSSSESVKNQIALKEKKADSVEEGELSKSSASDDHYFENNTKKIGMESKDFRFEKNTEVARQDWKMDPRTMPGYGYGYSMPMPPGLVPSGRGPQDNAKYDQSYYKNPANINAMNQEYYKHAQTSKGSPPPHYYYPYGYPMYDPQYAAVPPSEKGHESTKPQEKDKVKNAQKSPYQYPMHYPWGYHPYYMPPVPPSQQGQAQQNPNSQAGTEHPLPPSGKSSSSNPNNPYVGSTSININFPMYMCPPPHTPIQGSHYSIPPSRYPVPPPQMVNPYMGYQYGPYQDRNRTEGEYHAGQQGQTGYPRSGPQPSQTPPGQYPSKGKMPMYSNPGHYGSQGVRQGMQGGKYPPQPPPAYYYPPYMSYQGTQGQYPNKQKSPKKDN